MYLTGGLYRGHKIIVPKNTKPTLSKVRESVFNILSNLNLTGNDFLDMFAGSAIMGLEAISRGYLSKELEINPKTADIIKKNYNSLNLKPDITICDCLKYKTIKKYDVIYLDPPWDYDYSLIIQKATGFLAPKGIIIIEFDELKKIDIEIIINEKNLALETIKEKKYGRARLCFLKEK